MIKYRPQKSTLNESLAAAIEFDALDEMYAYIVTELGEDGLLFSKDDICIENYTLKDKRCDWKENRSVCVKRMGSQTFETPRCIGFCSIE